LNYERRERFQDHLGSNLGPRKSGWHHHGGKAVVYQDDSLLNGVHLADLKHIPECRAADDSETGDCDGRLSWELEKSNN
jgi:hypothetical protein